MSEKIMVRDMRMFSSKFGPTSEVPKFRSDPNVIQIETVPWFFILIEEPSGRPFIYVKKCLDPA